MAKKNGQKQGDNKTIKCAAQDCNATKAVPKWASNTQYCEEHIHHVEMEDQLDMSAIVPAPTAISKLQQSQQVLSQLGFVITSRGWRKQYAEGEAIIVLEPYFDQGTSVDQDHVLVSFMLHRQELIPVTDANISDKLPAVTHQDVQALIQELQVKMPGVALEQTHIDTVVCDKCHNKAEEWIVIGKQTLCMAQCAPTRKPYGRQ